MIIAIRITKGFFVIGWFYRLCGDLISAAYHKRSFFIGVKQMTVKEIAKLLLEHSSYVGHEEFEEYLDLMECSLSSSAINELPTNIEYLAGLITTGFESFFLNKIEYYELEKQKVFNENIEILEGIKNDMLEIKKLLSKNDSSINNDIPIYHNFSSDKKSKDLKYGFCYICKHGNTNKYKIGVTIDISRREKDFITGNPDVVMIAHLRSCKYTKVEKMIHSLLENKNISGEWFELNKNDLELLIKSFGFNRCIDTMGVK